jgi:hypothetical protein
MRNFFVHGGKCLWLKSERKTSGSFYTKGGDFRRWYGNIELIIDWSPKAISFYKSNTTSNLLAEKYRFAEGLHIPR